MSTPLAGTGCGISWPRPPTCRPRGERFVARACGGDDELRRQAESLLATMGPGHYLEELASRAGLPMAGEDHTPPAGLERVGAYRLVRRIGEGGMGAVYLADRADGEFEMRVAVKLLPGGVHTETMRRRFADERRILARLDHPGIGRLLDGGITEAGIPFLVMEYAAGVPIDLYCDDNLLDVDARLALFLEVCDAVDFAHSHDVVHRDLKPSNILVSADGRVKLLDFGIAKVLDGATEQDSTLTSLGSAPMTPNYASPEQITGETVGFGSDVYQLAALLYLLLTGRLPSEPVDRGSWAERSRAVANRRVVPASTAVGMAGQPLGRQPGSSPEVRARARGSTVATLRSRFAGSLDAIITKALRRDPDRRYQSAHALGEEIRRYRDGRTVAARLETAGRPQGLKHLESTAHPRPPGPGPEPARQPGTLRLAVLPFAGPADAKRSHLHHGIGSLLATAMDDSGIVSPTSTPVHEPVTDPTLARDMAKQLGAHLFVLGTAVDAQQTVRIDAGLYDVRDHRRPRAILTVEGTSDTLLDLVDTLAKNILCAATPVRSAELARAAADTTSLATLKLFLQGEQALHMGDFFPAADAFQRAIQADPSFALGYYRLALAAFWAHNLGLTRRFAAEAAARSERLPPRERRLLAALQLYLDGHASAAERSYSALLDEDPGNLEAAFLLGTLLFFHNALRGRSHAEARPCFERVLANQPNHILSLLYLSTIVARAGDLGALDRLTERLLDAYPDGGVPGYPIVARAQRAFAGEDAEEQDRVVEEVRVAGSLAAITACQVVVVPGKDLSGAERFARLLLTDPVGGAEVRATGHVVRAHLEFAGGRIRSAERELERAAAEGSVEALEFRALFALAPFIPVGRGKLVALRAELSARNLGDPLDAPPPIPHFAPHHGVHAHVRLFLLGLLDARLGAFGDALDRALELEAASPSSDDIALASFAATVRAEVAGRRSGPAAALAVLEAHELGTSMERALSSSLYAHGHSRFARAEWLLAAGRGDEALAWFESLADFSVLDAIYLGPARLRQAGILAARGDEHLAAPHYRWFLELWADCEPSLRPRVEEARARTRSPDPRAAVGPVEPGKGPESQVIDV
jgi:serine/threonine protein kinase/tetratricopeptide (TPR) repeat protein